VEKLVEGLVLCALDFDGNFFCHINDVHFESRAVDWKLFVYDVVFPVTAKELFDIKL